MTKSDLDQITVSIVSHDQGDLIKALLIDLSHCQNVAEVILTQNIPEKDIICPKTLEHRLKIIRNKDPKGFGANHNQAFSFCKTSMFAVLNPDIRLIADPFPKLSRTLQSRSSGLVAPLVINSSGNFEDSMRRFPTPLSLIRKLLKMGDGRIEHKELDPLEVDWCAGMFLLFSSSIYREIGGFDENFFLYYEDVDICARLWASGRSVTVDPGVTVLHDAQRTSRRKPYYMKYHLLSMARYFFKHWGRLPKIPLSN